jgi:hypothetical protein
MLTDQEKNHILEEELYRREVKIGLEVADSKGDKWQKYWSIVNSGVFIWFLSSIVLGTASFLYTTWERENEQARDKATKAYVIERENQRTASRLDAEITSRLVYFNDLLIMRNITKEYDQFDLPKLVVALDRPLAADYPINVFPEYLNRNLRSLLWELMQVTSEQERGSIRPAYEKTLQLQMIYLKQLYGSEPHPPGEVINPAQAVALAESLFATEEFYTTLNLQRWGSPFTKLLQKERYKKGSGSVRGK